MTKKIISIALVTLAALSASTPSICMFQKLKQFTPTIKAFSLLKPTSYNFSRPFSTKKTFPLMQQVIDSPENYLEKLIVEKEFKGKIINLKQEITKALKKEDTSEVEYCARKINAMHKEIRNEIFDSIEQNNLKELYLRIDLAINIDKLTLALMLKDACREKDRYGHSYGYQGCPNYGNKKEIVKFLLEKTDAKKTINDSGFGINVLNEACKIKNLEIIKLLLDHGAKIDKELNPIFTACLMGNLEILKELLSKFPEEINEPNQDHYWTVGGQGECSSWEKASYFGKTLLYVACEKGNPEIIKYLLIKGAKVDKNSIKDLESIMCKSQIGHLSWSENPEKDLSKILSTQARIKQYLEITLKYNEAENKEQFVMSKIQDTEEFEFLKEMHAKRKK